MNNKAKRILYSIIDNLLVGCSIGILRLSKSGLDPLNFMNSGFSNFLSRDFGTVITVCDMIILVIVFFCHRKSIGLGTVISMATVGYTADFVYMLIKFMNTDRFWINFTFLLIGINIMCFEAGMYLEADLGVSAYDSMPFVVDSVLKKDFSHKYARIVLDIITILVGITFGQQIGVGTIFLGFLSGPLVVFYRDLSEKLIFKNR